MALVNFSDIQNGDSATADVWNSRYAAILSALNGGLDSNNIADNGVTSNKVVNGAIVTSKIADAAVTPSKVTNPYKFRGVLGSDQVGVVSSAWTTANLSSESYDTNNNFASGIYTVPVNGFYHFDALLTTTSIGNGYRGGGIRLLKNGTSAPSGSPSTFDDAVSYDYLTYNLSDTLQLVAGDTIQLQGLVYSTTSYTGTFGFSWGNADSLTRLSGYLVSPT